jgi:hypothetical protein
LLEVRCVHDIFKCILNKPLTGEEEEGEAMNTSNKWTKKGQGTFIYPALLSIPF